MVYGNCSSQATCEDLHQTNSCRDNSTEGKSCVCAYGLLRRGEKCVREEDCGCFVEGKGFKEGENFLNNNCSRNCSCLDNKVTCENYECSANETCGEIEGASKCLCKEGFILDGQNCVKRRADCLDLYNDGITTDGIYTIRPAGWPAPGFQVYCEMESNGGGWTVFQRRVDGTVDFYRNWTYFKNGFGEVNHEFWLGNDKIHAITKQTKYELRIDFVTSLNLSNFNVFDNFTIADEKDKYRLGLGKHVAGNAGLYTFDSLYSYIGMQAYGGG
ncbi:Ficolin-1 [Holothuria leucospilota]|uniref:Ficolin-1 n=1 Tax=Holothuria leucospilota TaxID=206669 RepID=A0A9Q1BS53_HOLLE|nr:Ficolin-1 [Holothuria leucospilota]